MKMFAALLIISTGLGLNTVATAEPFTEGGEYYITTVKTNPDTPRVVVDAEPDHPFNDRGKNYIVDVPTGSESQNPLTSPHDSDVQRWNS